MGTVEVTIVIVDLYLRAGQALRALQRCAAVAQQGTLQEGGRQRRVRGGASRGAERASAAAAPIDRHAAVLLPDGVTRATKASVQWHDTAATPRRTT